MGKLLALGFVASLLGPLSLASAQRVLWVEIPTDLQCPSGPAVIAALEARMGSGSVIKGRPPSSERRLRLASETDNVLTLLLTDGDETILERRITFRDEPCQQRAEALALIADTWLAPPSVASVAPGEGRASATSLPPDSTDPSRSGSSSHAEAAATSTSAAEPAASVSPLSSSPSHGAKATLAPPAPGELDVELTMGTGIEPAPAGASLLVRGGMVAFWAPWLVGVRGGVETASDLSDSLYPTNVQRFPLDVFIGRELFAPGRWAMTLLAGPGLDLLRIQVRSAHPGSLPQESSTQWLETGSYTTAFTLEPVLFFGLRGAYRVGTRWTLLAEADLALTLLKTDLTVANVGVVGSLPTSRARILLGATWRLF